VKYYLPQETPWNASEKLALRLPSASLASSAALISPGSALITAFGGGGMGGEGYVLSTSTFGVQFSAWKCLKIPQKVIFFFFFSTWLQTGHAMTQHSLEMQRFWPIFMERKK